MCLLVLALVRLMRFSRALQETVERLQDDPFVSEPSNWTARQ